jgi:hypothetical protein
VQLLKFLELGKLSFRAERNVLAAFQFGDAFR